MRLRLWHTAHHPRPKPAARAHAVTARARTQPPRRTTAAPKTRPNAGHLRRGRAHARGDAEPLRAVHEDLRRPDPAHVEGGLRREPAGHEGAPLLLPQGRRRLRRDEPRGPVHADAHRLPPRPPRRARVARGAPLARRPPRDELQSARRRRPHAALAVRGVGLGEVRAAVIDAAARAPARARRPGRVARGGRAARGLPPGPATGVPRGLLLRSKAPSSRIPARRSPTRSRSARTSSAWRCRSARSGTSPTSASTSRSPRPRRPRRSPTTRRTWSECVVAVPNPRPW